MIITDQQGRAIAYLLHEIRPDWGIASLMSLIDKHRDVPSLGALTIAATTKAMEPSCKTPAPIFTPGAHWPVAARAHLPKPEPCADHVGQDGITCRSCHADVKAGDRPESMIGKAWNPLESAESEVQ